MMLALLYKICFFVFCLFGFDSCRPVEGSVVGAGDGLSLASTSHRDTSLLPSGSLQKFETFDHTRPLCFPLFSLTVFCYDYF